MFISPGVMVGSLSILPVWAKSVSISGFITTTSVVYLTAMFLFLSLYNVDQMYEIHSSLFHEMFSRPLRITTNIINFKKTDVQYIT